MLRWITRLCLLLALGFFAPGEATARIRLDARPNHSAEEKLAPEVFDSELAFARLAAALQAAQLQQAKSADGYDLTPGCSLAREQVVRDFYEGRPGLGQARASQDLGCHPTTDMANQHPAGYGIDLSKPVSVVDLPPSAAVNQYVKKHGTPGAFFDAQGKQTAAALGLNPDPTLRQAKTFTVPVTDPEQQALISGN